MRHAAALLRSLARGRLFFVMVVVVLVLVAAAAAAVAVARLTAGTGNTLATCDYQVVLAQSKSQWWACDWCARDYYYYYYYYFFFFFR